MTRTGAPRVYRFFLPEIICGWGSLVEAGRTTCRIGARRILVVTEPEAVDSGWVAALQRSLERAGLEHVTWSTEAPDARDDEVVTALQVYRARDCDVIIGMGGHAAMDTAKAVAVLSSNGGSVADYDGFDRVTQPTPPTVMIPTTIGSGAEIVQSCAISDTSRRRTVTMLGCALVADACLVDPRLMSTLPPERVAAGGFEAIAMAIEGYLSRTATAMNEPHALVALRLISDHLVPAVDAPGDKKEVTALVTAGVHAAVAFSNTLQSTTGALSGLLAAFLGLPRGTVRGVLLPHAIRPQTSPYVDRYLAVAGAVGLDTAGASGSWAAHAVADWLRTIGDKVGIPAGLSGLGVGPDTAVRIARGATRGGDSRSDHDRSDHDTASFEYASHLLRAAL
jgi:alcohol dehydrogenase class IV